jgi:hypothetical protein
LKLLDELHIDNSGGHNAVTIQGQGDRIGCDTISWKTVQVIWTNCGSETLSQKGKQVGGNIWHWRGVASKKICVLSNPDTGSKNVDAISRCRSIIDSSSGWLANCSTIGIRL